ncbi:uncharacterized protein LOC108911701 isoform X2 [Anoplophora glabripennis]|uniref:uncharacterized protein LOC108911701 isoform X2 n=1 Tax=Anoplophora glabripennis TaxID=217634 RepID=UPI0008749B8E|nr:uncharacterized protein LOC108911701 isoform X2 [Anoplophora glabripennis]
MAYEDLLTPGTELSELKFTGFWDWFINVSDIRIHWKHEPTYVISQFAYLFGGIATFVHARIWKGRLPYLWISVVLHGLVVESLSYFLRPHVDNFWHSQTPVMFLGGRLPLHIIFLYACFLYNSSVAVAKMRLPKWSEPFAVGLGVVLIDIPYDIISVNFLHWTWHDTDPNIYDRHYWVPWNSYYFHACFAASFTFWFHYTREKLCNSEGKWLADKRVSRELLCSVIAALLGTPGGVLLFIPIYHPLHDVFKIHSEVTFSILFAIFLLLIWSGDRKPKDKVSNTAVHKTHWSTWILIVHLIIHYAAFMIMPIFFNPEDEISTGLKEPIGPCDQYEDVKTAFGMTLQKRKYLCSSDYDEKYFDWHCLPDGRPPSSGSIWYTACGVPFPNRAEYISITALFCLIAAVVFRNLHFKSYGDAVFTQKYENVKDKSKKKV